MDIHERLQRHLKADESTLLVTDTDLTQEGRFGKRWIVVTDQRVMTFADEPSRNGFECELHLADMQQVRTVHHVGRISIEVDTNSHRVQLLSCTNSLAERFAKAAKALDDACKKNELPVFHALDEEEDRYCQECGRLLPERGRFCPACLKKHKVLARFWKYMRPHWPKAMLVSIAILIGTMAELAPPYLVRTLVDDVLMGDGGHRELLFLVMGLVFFQVVAMGIAILRGRMSVWLGSTVIHEVRLDLYQAIQHLTLRRYDKTQVGSLLSRLTGDTMMLNDALQFVGFMALPSILQLVGICAVLLYMDFRLGLLVLIPAPIVVFLTWRFFKLIHGYYYQWWQRRAKMTALANDSIGGMRVVKAFSQENQEQERFAVRSDQARAAWYNCDSLITTAMPMLSFVTTTGMFLVWYFGGRGILQGSETLTVGTLMAFVAYLGMFFGPLQMLTRLTDFLNRAFTAAQRLFEIMDTDQEIYDDPNAEPLHEPVGSFEFQNVHFGYTPDKPVLEGVNVKIEPGEMIGLVGKSGVGKTTLINLICRFYDVEEGAILLDGRDLRSIQLRDLRQHIGIVSQDSYLFNGKIYNNIAYAKPGASPEEVIHAAMTANAHGFIMRQPDGYETYVGERGAQLSGGERQRISIARALLHDPKILILDEATSSVDTETEELIQEALRRLVKGRTTFAIAHRLSTLRNADRLLVLDDGKVAEFGTHDELLAKRNGVYRGLVEMQSQLSAITAIGG